VKALTRYTWIVTACKCRDREVRQAALEQLKRLPDVSYGLWDSRAALAIVTYFNAREDEYAEFFQQPADYWTIVLSRYVLFNQRGDSCVAGAMRWTEGGWAMVEETISW
jgi:hypothetical protein